MTSGSAIWFSFSNKGGLLFKGVATLTAVDAECIEFETAGANGAVMWKMFGADSIERIEASEIEDRFVPAGYTVRECVWRIASETKGLLLIGELKRSVVN
jgi:hypothetical protein